MTSTLGWTVRDWKKFHAENPEKSFAQLLQLVNSLDPEDPAWIARCDEDKLEQQWTILQSRANCKELPLYGVPVAVKDNIDVLEFPTTAACPAFEFQPARDATVVELLKANGAIIIGKTNLDQFATGLVGVRSPYGKPSSVFSNKHVSGGSSSGSGNTCGRGIVPLALGTDTAGSGRVPAMLNNLIGLKPSRGVLSCSGVLPACKSLDVVSIFALNLRDAQLAFNLLAKPDLANDCYSRPMPKDPLHKFYACASRGEFVKIAVPASLPWYGEEGNAALFEQAVAKFGAMPNVKVEKIDFTQLLELAKCLYEGPWVAERYAALEKFYASNPDKSSIDPIVYSIVQTAKKFDAKDYFNYEYKRQTILQALRTEILDVFDAMIVPTAPLNPTFEDLEKEPVKVNSWQGTWTNFVNLADLAALSIPAGFKENGLPFGVTLLANTFTDYALLDLASQYLTKYSKDRFVGGLKDISVADGDVLDYAIQQQVATANKGDIVELAVVGAHLKGLPLHWQLEKVNATFLRATKTSKHYKLYALAKTGPVLKPGLRRVPADGHSIDLEVYAVSKAKFGEFVAMVPEPLGIGSVELATGEWTKSFICEEIGYADTKAVDISEFGGFKQYVATLDKKTHREITFKRVLIANRGEIAVRIIKTLHKLGIEAVAVYSDPDKYSQHVTLADVAVHLPGTKAADTYLRGDLLIEAAKKHKVDAIIPGYGFLSENADFAESCEKNGIVFCGPSAKAIRSLGLKHSARAIAEQAKVPLVPGSDLIKDAQEAKEFAAKIGYPIMIKSTAGGGGIGLQKVDSADDIERIFESVQHQGQQYFGDAGVFIERFIDQARHVEVQVLGDGHGEAVAVGERDCSLQRRNQKVIEETPAPNLSAATRAKLHAAAENLAKSMHYKSAGTVEFIFDAHRDEFYFLEVNTRLQVEHPITEMVTGLDLVEWMLYIAMDQAQDLKSLKESIKVQGWSMEARLYAENPLKQFLPSPGQLTHVSFPEWARVDTWVQKGTNVSSEYDPTLAKIIVHGTDRADALQKLVKALEETQVYGVVTNADYLKSIITTPFFKNVAFHTKILDSFEYASAAIEILEPGAYTTVQDLGRKGYWRIGVPPSGPMDDLSFKLANKIVGNDANAPALEMTLVAPTVKFHGDAVVAIAGGSVAATLDGKPVGILEPIHVKGGQTLAVGKLSSGCRAYLAVRNGLDVGEYLGSRSTFALGNLGGYNGRTLKFGDVLFVAQPESAGNTLPVPVGAPVALTRALAPSLDTKKWHIGVTCGPHGAPDIFKPEFEKTFFNDEWKVHYNSNRFGVRLIGPKPSWARADGGEGGLHPSNAHDYVYSMGAINFTGDEPVILTCDGPSLGGFVCHAVVCEAEMWKVGQVKPGDSINFVPVSYDAARALKKQQDEFVASFSKPLGDVTKLALSAAENPVLHTIAAVAGKTPKVVYRAAGDRYILVEYGSDKMDLNMSYRVHSLIELVNKYHTVGILEMSQGVRSVLVEFDGTQVSQQTLLKTLVAYEKQLTLSKRWTVKSKVIRLPMAFEDSKTLAAVKRYQETIRASAPWLPSNIDFVAKINGMTRDDVRDLMYKARFLVLGLGDVFLGAPCAVPLQGELTARKFPLPFIGTKYNPSRTYTPNGVVGLGGMYMCIYTMESPGGYQLIGRTVPIWDKLSLGSHSENPWLLTPFDQIEFYPVSESELDAMTEQCNNGKFKMDIADSVFDFGDYTDFLEAHKADIEKVKEEKKIGEKLEEFKRLIQISNQELLTSAAPKQAEQQTYPDDAVKVYSQYSGRFWKPLVKVGDVVAKDQGLIVVEAMKTEMVVTASAPGKVLSILHGNGDMVDAGDLVVVLQ